MDIAILDGYAENPGDLSWAPIGDQGTLKVYDRTPPEEVAARIGGAQIVFTTHNTELMNLELLRKDQLYFVDKYDKDGTSELYSISEFTTRTTENVRKGYLVGKYGATPDIEIEEVE